MDIGNPLGVGQVKDTQQIVEFLSKKWSGR